MKYLLLALTIISLKTYAQTEEDAVKLTIKTLFNGMRQSDSSMLRSAFAPGVILQTVVKNKEGKTIVRSEVVDSFIVFVAKPHDKMYDERIKFETVKVDGDLATVWTPYKFYLGETLSHCGVNSFQLVKLDGKWRIQYLIDTRRRAGCESGVWKPEFIDQP